MTKIEIAKIFFVRHYRPHSLRCMLIMPFVAMLSFLMLLYPGLCSATVTLLTSDSRSIELEFTIGGFHTETLQHEGKTYQRIYIQNTIQSARPGEPQLPQCGTMVGLPAIHGVSLDILDAQYETLQGYNMYPALKSGIEGENPDTFPSGRIKQTFFENQHIYTTNAFFPDTPVKMGNTGYLRDQPVAQVHFTPVQFNPVTGEVRIYRKIVACVSWKEVSLSLEKKPSMASPFFENLLKKKIINYHNIKRPVIAENSYRPPVQRKRDSSGTEASPRLKITVKEEGMYTLSYNDLIDAGFDVDAIDPRNLTMTNKGEEIAIFIEGEEDGVFNTSDAIVFYGEEYTDIYTDKNVYWLTTGSANGIRMNTHDGAPSGNAVVPDYFPATIHVEENTYYWQTMPEGEGQDHYFWGGKLTAPQTKELTLNIKNILSGPETAAIRVQLKGYTDVSKSDPDHHTKIYINDKEIDDQYWNGRIVFDHEATVSHEYLNNGENTITVETVGDTGASVDQLLVNWAEIDYLDTYVAENDALFFRAPSEGVYQFEVSSFTGSDLEVFDITDHNAVVRVINTNIVSGNKRYTLQFEVKLDFIMTPEVERQQKIHITIRRGCPI